LSEIRGVPPGMRVLQRDLQEAADLDFTEEEEHWNVYKLSDGSTLKVKLVLRGVKRLKRYNPDGTPIYVIQSQNIVRSVNVPEKIKEKPKESTFKPV
jgi:hypothetical protein